MLLDRKKIRRWAKWVALGLVIVFAVAFLLAGVGNGSGGFNISEVFNGGCNAGSTDDTQAATAELQTMLDALKAKPTDTAKMLEIAAYFEGLFKAGQKTDATQAQNAIEYLNKALEVDPTLKAVYLDVAKLYISIGQLNSDMSSYISAAKVLNQATAIDPSNPDIYFYLGQAQKLAGRTGEAILAWQKYLELDPNSKLAATVRTELQELMTPSTTTTVAPTTTTAVSGTTTTVSSTTTTAK